MTLLTPTLIMTTLITTITTITRIMSLPTARTLARRMIAPQAQSQLCQRKA
jgi:hypothetical protein